MDRGKEDIVIVQEVLAGDPEAAAGVTSDSLSLGRTSALGHGIHGGQRKWGKEQVLLFP